MVDKVEWVEDEDVLVVVELVDEVEVDVDDNVEELEDVTVEDEDTVELEDVVVVEVEVCEDELLEVVVDV